MDSPRPMSRAENNLITLRSVHTVWVYFCFSGGFKLQFGLSNVRFEHCSVVFVL